MSPHALFAIAHVCARMGATPEAAYTATYQLDPSQRGARDAAVCVALAFGCADGDIEALVQEACDHADKLVSFL